MAGRGQILGGRSLNMMDLELRVAVGEAEWAEWWQEDVFLKSS